MTTLNHTRADPLPLRAPATAWQRLCRSLVLRRLDGLSSGRLVFREGRRRFDVGRLLRRVASMGYYELGVVGMDRSTRARRL